MAEPVNPASPSAVGKASEPVENGQVGAGAGDKHTAGGASEGHEATKATGASKPNGATKATSATTPKKKPPTEDQDQDVDMKDSADTEEAMATPAAAQTPATGKKASNGSSKKKAAVPEHKTKKINKKASKRLTNLDAEPGQYYLARMKGHPPWPSIICDEEMLPMSLLDTRPVTTKLPDGTYKKAEYADGGKRVHDRTFPIMFLWVKYYSVYREGLLTTMIRHTNELLGLPKNVLLANLSNSAWMPNTDLTPLDTAAIDPDDTKGKTKPLAAAYAKASEENDLQHFKEMLADHQMAVKEEQEAQAERDAKKATKTKRKSIDASAAAADDEDEMDVDEDEEAPKPKSKKRKKEADSDGEEKPAKTPKTGTKLKLSTPKTPVEPSSKKKASKPKSSTKKAAKASDDEAVETPKVEEKKLTAEEARQMEQKKVLYFRHKLQRGFLSRDTPPKEDEMKSMSEFLGELETYPDLEGSIIRTTKINKVLKGMLKITSIPQDEVYHFKDRSLKLLTAWNETLAKEGAGGSADKDDEGKTEGAALMTNGTANNSEEQAAKAETGGAAAPEEEKTEAIDNKIGTTTEGEKEAENGPSKANGDEKIDDTKGDEPDVEGAPAEEYQPPTTEVAS
ncbi:MAG: hypothetical protein LQ343_003191 [Gyalolechia ehrenbergii]|nr:MAG: hypothetical protein LQ343_003191 [Gyalolechia ehrenbergii]